VFERAQRFRGFARVDEVITLVGKIERRLDARGQIKEFAIDLADALGQRAFELIERRARLQRRDGVDEVGNRLRLNEVDAVVEKSAEREFARLGEPGAGLHRLLDDLAKHDRAAVRADFDDVFTGVGVRSRKVGRNDLIAPDARERGVPRAKRRVVGE